MTNEINSAINLLKNNIQQIGSVKAYVFGSASRSDTAPNDIDILIIYNTPEQAKIIRAMLSYSGYLPIHLLFLTDDEEVETNFIITQKCIRLL